jgi:LAO/AO transport system kinase
VTLTADTLAERLLAGDRAALARAITWAENRDGRFPALLATLWPRVGKSLRTGVTGPPGAGKSTLVNELARLVRAEQRTVGILAVDPSSPYTGGALLGDRIRMQERTLDPGVFIRSMASRGARGGLAAGAIDACDAMDAFGFDELLIETVGVGQAEYEVVSAADTVLVVVCPGAGDAIQAMKAGLLEVADILVVNKADVPGAERVATDLSEAVHIRTAGRTDWTPPVVACSAGRGEDVEAVLAAIHEHRRHLSAKGLEERRSKMRVEQIRRVVIERLGEEWWGRLGHAREVETLLRGGLAPYDVVSRQLAGLVDWLGSRSRPPERDETDT